MKTFKFLFSFIFVGLFISSTVFGQSNPFVKKRQKQNRRNAGRSTIKTQKAVQNACKLRTHDGSTSNSQPPNDPCSDVFGGLEWKISRAIKKGDFEKLNELKMKNSDKSVCFSCNRIVNAVESYVRGDREAQINLAKYKRDNGFDQRCQEIPSGDPTPSTCDGLFERGIDTWTSKEAEFFSSNNCCQQKKEEVLDGIDSYIQVIDGNPKKFMGIGSYNSKKDSFEKLAKLGCFNKCELSPDQDTPTIPGIDQMNGENFGYQGCEVRPTIDQIESFNAGYECSSEHQRDINMNDFIFYTLADLEGLVEVMKEDPVRFNEIVAEKIADETLCPDVKLVIKNYVLPGGNVTDPIKINASLNGSENIHFNCFKKGKGDLEDGKTDHGSNFPICCDERRKEEYLAELSSLGISFASACNPEVNKIEESGSTNGRVNLKYFANCGGKEDFVILIIRNFQR